MEGSQRLRNLDEMFEEVGLGSAIEEIGEEGLIAMKMFSQALIPCKKSKKK